MSNITKVIGMQYGDSAKALSNAVEWAIRMSDGEVVSITDIGSSDTTDLEHKGCVYETSYKYIFKDGVLTNIQLQCNDSSYLKNGLLVTVTDEMRGLYKEMMLLTHLVNECTKVSLLNDEEIAYPENWQDCT